MIQIEAIGVALLAKEQLEQDKEIKIHSRYENSMNLLINNQLIYVGERALPFGLQVRNFEEVKQAIFVYSKDAQLVFVHSKQIVYVQLHELEIIEDKHQGELNCASGKLKRLLEMVELKRIKKMNYYLGRGQGLTPSGDDFLIGLYCVSFYDSQLATRMKSLQNLDFLDFTTSISAAYLNAARSGRFNPVLIELLNTKSRVEFERLILEILEIGHSSGMDTLEGITLGLSMIQEENKV